VPQQRRRRVDVRRRAHLLRDAEKRHALAVQLSAPSDEVVHGGPASAERVGVTGQPDPESGVEVEPAAPASGASLAGGWGGPFAPQYAVASTTAATAARSIRTGWRG